MKNRILGIIPARGGSKGIPKKNTRPLLGRPLIAYTIEVALKSDLLDKVIVSSDDEETIEIAKKYGAEVPFIRPRELALDTIPMVPVLQHAVRFVEEIDNSLKKLMETGADSVISVSQVDNVHPVLMKRIENDLILPYCIEEKEGTRRQDYSPPAYMRNGAIYAVKRDILMNNDSVWGKISRPYIMPPERSASIDSELDFKLVEILLEERASTMRDQGKDITGGH